MEPSPPGARAAALAFGAAVIVGLAVVAATGEDEAPPAAPTPTEPAEPSLRRSAGPTDVCALPGSGHSWEIGLRDPGRQPDCPSRRPSG